MTGKIKYHYDTHHHHSIRLPNYDYSQSGAYFITICTQNREWLFGEIVDDKIRLNDAGFVIKKCWDEIPTHFPNVKLDECIIVGANDYSPLPQRPKGTSKTIGSIIRGFKIGATKWVRQNSLAFTIWQRNYFEHVIRNDNELNQIRQYVINNPLNWEKDENYCL